MAPEDVAVAFFSYCREDSEFALKLAADLKVAGAHVWIDQLDIEPGTPWDRAVEDALTHSPRMLVVLSPVSVNSDNVRDEVSFALSRQKRVIPVLYRDCEVPFRLARLQHIDFRPDYTRALTILLRALGVGHATPAQVPSVAAAVSAAEIVAPPAEAEEKARQQKVEEERRLADDQAQLEEGRRYAEQSRLRKEREAAAAQAAREQEQQQTEAEARARQEQSRREQRAAEQARLEEETRVAAERVRQAQQEKERREAEIKARQEQLRREEEESVERKSMVLEAERQSEREATKQESRPDTSSPSAGPAARPVVAAKPAPAPVRIEPPPNAAPDLQVPPPRQPQATGSNLTSPKYLAGGAALLVLLGLIIFLLTHRGGPEKAAESKAAEGKAAETATMQQTQPQPAAEKPPDPASASPAGQSASAPATAPNQDQTKEQAKPAATNAKEVPKSNPTGIYAKEIPKSKNPPAQNMADTSFLNSVAGSPKGAPLNASNTANTASSPNAVRISQGVSHGMLMHEVAPAYPPLARSARVQGQVVLDVVISKDGAVKTIKAETGHPMLIPAAIDAVKKWRYKPYFLNGKPVEVNTEVVVNFTLTN